MAVEYKATVDGLAALSKRLDNAARLFVVESTSTVTQLAQVNANTGAHSPGQPHIAGTGPGPNVVSGSNRRSIRPDPVIRTSEGWSGKAGPHMIYSRSLELGNPRWPAGLRFPYLGPAITTWKRLANSMLVRIVSQEVGHRG